MQALLDSTQILATLNATVASSAVTSRATVPWDTLSAALLRAQTAPHFARAHPRVKHLMPLFVALGVAHGDAVQTTELFSQIVMDTRLSLHTVSTQVCCATAGQLVSNSIGVPVFFCSEGGPLLTD